MNLKSLEITELLCLQASITNELKDREVVRTQNNPLGDYTEWLVAKALELELQPSSKAGYDGTDKNGLRIQIKGRRITASRNSRQLSAIRKYSEKDFDMLAAVLFDEHFVVTEALLIPHQVIGLYASYRKHVNAHILSLRGAILKAPEVKCIKQLLISQQAAHWEGLKSATELNKS